jgi:capsular exopolysaccharide synthesis family protein
VYGVALGVGLGGPYAVLIFLGLLRYKLEDLEELKELTQLPIIANTPIVSDADKDETGIVVLFGRNSAIDEVFSMMRTNLLFMMGEGRHVILFTSTTSGEGKSFNSTNLAVSYALTEKRVILCGLDIRKPALGSLFNLSDRRKGITTLLTKETVTKEDIEKQIQPSGVNDHLDLLLSGPIPPNPTELLARDSLRQILDILKETYDYIILDTAPVGLVTDTLQISKLADVTVFVCRAKYTPTIAITQLNGLAEEKLLTNPCIVLNGSSN